MQLFKKGSILLVMLLMFSISSASTPVLRDSLNVDRNEEIQQKSFDGDFKEQYKGEDYKYTTLSNPDNWFNQFKNWFKDMLINLFQMKNDINDSSLMDILYSIVYALIFLISLIILLRAILNKEARWIFGRRSKGKLSMFDIEQNLHQVNFRDLISKAVNNSDYRLAIRFYYLWLLKVMSDDRIIEYDVEKTNSDYHREIEDQNIKNRFNATSYLYNYIWYGKFDIDQQQYTEASNIYKEFINSILK